MLCGYVYGCVWYANVRICYLIPRKIKPNDTTPQQEAAAAAGAAEEAEALRAALAQKEEEFNAVHGECYRCVLFLFFCGGGTWHASDHHHH